jgi:hypothetical protein
MDDIITTQDYWLIDSMYDAKIAWYGVSREKKNLGGGR